MATFPSYYKITEFNVSSQDQVRRTPTEDGEAKQALRYYNMPINAEVEIIFTAAQWDTFQTWMKTNRHDYFTFTNWLNDTSYSMRIVGGEFSATPLNKQMTHILVSMVMEYEV